MIVVVFERDECAFAAFRQDFLKVFSAFLCAFAPLRWALNFLQVLI
jgi:hypothetical protein